MTTNETQCCTAGTVTAGHVHSANCRPDALTRLERHLKREWASMVEHEAKTAFLLSEARKEMEEMRAEVEVLRGAVSMHMRREAKALSNASRAERDATAVSARLALTQEACNTLSAKSSEALRQGQQQGRVELAHEIYALMHEKDGASRLQAFLEAEINEDAGQ